MFCERTKCYHNSYYSLKLIELQPIILTSCMLLTKRRTSIFQKVQFFIYLNGSIKPRNPTLPKASFEEMLSQKADKLNQTIDNGWPSWWCNIPNFRQKKGRLQLCWTFTVNSRWSTNDMRHWNFPVHWQSQDNHFGNWTVINEYHILIRANIWIYPRVQINWWTNIRINLYLLNIPNEYPNKFVHFNIFQMNILTYSEIK